MDEQIEPGTGDAPPPPPDEPRRRRGRPRAQLRPAAEMDPGPPDDDDGDGRQMSLEDLEARETMDRGLPRIVENVKTLAELMAKYDIGNKPEFEVVLYRATPKYWKNTKIDGFYGRYTSPLTEEYLASTFGGGQYSVRIEGPHPTKGANHKKHYDSVLVSLPYDPILENVPARASDAVAPPTPAAVTMPEDAKTVGVALGVLQTALGNERADRKDAEQRAQHVALPVADNTALDRVASAHDKRADDLSKMADERLKAERASAEERIKSERENADKLLGYERDERQRLAKKVEELTDMIQREQQQPRQSVGQELAAVLGAMPRPAEPVKDDSMRVFADATIKDMQARHAEDISRMSTQHSQVVEAMRSSHAEEKRVAYDGYQRDIASERENARRREDTFEERLKSEREERRRDQDAARTRLEDVERQWKDRMQQQEQQWKDRVEQQKATIEQSFEMRFQSAQTNWENRLQWLTAELDRAKVDVTDLRARGYEQSDPIAVIDKHRQLREALGVTDQPAQGNGAGGIGMGGTDDNAWKTVLAEGFTERMPLMLQQISNIFTKPGQPQQQGQQQPTHGQVIVENGIEYVILNTPQGWMKTPRAQYLANQAAQEARTRQQATVEDNRGLLEDGTRRTSARRGAGPARRRSRGSPMPVPDTSIGLEKPRSGVGDENVQEMMMRASEATLTASGTAVPPRPAPPPPPPPPAAPHPPQQHAAPAPDQPMEPSDGGAIRMSAQERVALKYIAKWVHDAVTTGEEPEEWVVNIGSQVQPGMLKAVVTNYTTEQIANGIVALYPSSAGATPAGQKFVREAFGLLHQQVAAGG